MEQGSIRLLILHCVGTFLKQHNLQHGQRAMAQEIAGGSLLLAGYPSQPSHLHPLDQTHLLSLDQTHHTKNHRQLLKDPHHLAYQV